MLSIKEILVQSIRMVYSNKKFIFLFWFSNVLFAFALSLPIYNLIHDHLSHSIISNQLLSSFDIVWFNQFNVLYQKSIAPIPSMLFAVCGIYIFLQIFFVGGLISVFINKKKNHYVDFFYGSVKYFLRFTKIALISFSIYFVALSINVLLNGLIVTYIIPVGNELILFLNQLGRYLLLLMMISIINIISDYAKVSAAVNDNYKAFPNMINAVRFVKSNFIKVFILFLIVSSFVAIGGILYNTIENFIPKTPVYMLLLTFIIQQMLIILRFVIRMIFYSTEVIVFNDFHAEVVSPLVEEVQGV